MPDLVHTVTFGVARLAVLDPAVERHVLVGPLLAAVIAGDNAVTISRLGTGSNWQRRPVAGARSVAHGFARSVLGEGVQGHALGIDQDLAHAGVSNFGWRIGKGQAGQAGHGDGGS